MERDVFAMVGLFSKFFVPESGFFGGPVPGTFALKVAAGFNDFVFGEFEFGFGAEAL